MRNRNGSHYEINQKQPNIQCTFIWSLPWAIDAHDKNDFHERMIIAHACHSLRPHHGIQTPPSSHDLKSKVGALKSKVKCTRGSFFSLGFRMNIKCKRNMSSLRSNASHAKGCHAYVYTAHATTPHATRADLNLCPRLLFWLAREETWTYLPRHQ